MSATTIGRVVHYKLDEHDAALINARRDADPASGNRVQAGEDYPAVVVRTWGSTPETASVNLQVWLDGRDTHWATSRSEGNEQGRWHWPVRV